MEEKKGTVEGSGGGRVGEELYRNEISEEKGEKRETIGSAVTPSLDRLVSADGSDSNHRRGKDRERKKKRREKAKAMRMNKSRSAEDPEDDDGNEEDDSTVISSSSNRSKEDAERIRQLEATIAALEAKQAKSRRQSVAEVGLELHSRMVYSMTEVKEEDKLKVANGHTLLDLFMKIEDAKNIGQHRQTLSYLSLDVKNNLLMFMSQGNAKEAGWHSHDFVEIKDLNSLSDSDIQNLLILMVRPNEKGMLVRILNNIKIPLSPTTAEKPLYLALRPILRGVLSYLQTYEKLYRMLSGEQGVLVNGKTIGQDPNMAIELNKKVKGGESYLDSHEAILKNTLVTNGPIPAKFYDNLKASEERGIINYLLSAVNSIDKIHPRAEKKSTHDFKIKAARDAKYTQVMTFPDKPGVYGQVLIETMKYNINIFLTIYDKFVMPFYAMMQTEPDLKTRKVASMLGYILSNNEDDEDREVFVDRVMNDEYADDYEHKICLLEERLANANEEAAVAKRNYNDLVAQRNAELFYVANNPNNPADGRYPVKIATGATSTLRKPGQVTILTKKPCFAEARAEGSCQHGRNCRYSHDRRDIEKLRNDPKALKNLQVLTVLAEHSPDCYETKADEFSEEY